MKEEISKNFFKGKAIKKPHEIINMANNKKSFYHQRWGIKPASILLSMHFRIVMNLIITEQIYKTVKK